MDQESPAAPTAPSASQGTGGGGLGSWAPASETFGFLLFLLRLMGLDLLKGDLTPVLGVNSTATPPRDAQGLHPHAHPSACKHIPGVAEGCHPAAPASGRSTDRTRWFCQQPETCLALSALHQWGSGVQWSRQPTQASALWPPGASGASEQIRV